MGTQHSVLGNMIVLWTLKYLNICKNSPVNTKDANRRAHLNTLTFIFYLYLCHFGHYTQCGLLGRASHEKFWILVRSFKFSTLQSFGQLYHHRPRRKNLFALVIYPKSLWILSLGCTLYTSVSQNYLFNEFKISKF